LLAWCVAGLAWGQSAAPEDTGADTARLVERYLLWGSAWVGLAAGLCLILFKLYALRPDFERWLVTATLIVMPLLATFLTTAHLPLVGWLAPREYGLDNGVVFAFWCAVALGFGAAWRAVKTRTSWLDPAQDAHPRSTNTAEIRRAPRVPGAGASAELPTGQSNPQDRASPPAGGSGFDDRQHETGPYSAVRSPADPRAVGAAARSRPERTRADSIFISYRRQDSADVTGRIYDRLVLSFDRRQVFKDVDSIPLGVDFRAHLGEVVGHCDVLLAVIGPQWLTASGADGRRLDDPADFVRIEIEAALARDIPVIPLLVGGTGLPSAKELPQALAPITYRNGISVRPDPDFHRDMDRLIASLREQR